MDIGPGDYVEYVDDSVGPHEQFRAEDCLSLGRLYLVDAIFVNDLGTPSLEIRGHPRAVASARWGFRVGYAVRRFRPIYRRKTDAFTHLLTEIPPDLEVA